MSEEKFDPTKPFYRTDVSSIIYGSYVKYDTLERLVYDTYSNCSISSATELNVFVDLCSIMHQIFSDKNRIIVEDYSDVVSCIINMCAHYRYFFYNRLKVTTKFFLIFSFNVNELSRKFCAEYNGEFYKKITATDKYTKIVGNNLELLDKLCRYLPDIFFIKSDAGYDTSVIISHIIDKLHDGKPNLIISKEAMPIQLCSLHPYTSYLRPIKSRDEHGNPIDTSMMTPISEKYNYREMFWYFVSNDIKTNAKYYIDINPINYTLLMSLYKYPKRGYMQTTVDISTASKIILDLGGRDIKVLPEMLYNSPLAIQYPISKAEARYKTLDVPFMRQYYDIDPESNKIQFINIRDDSMVNHINSKFFSNNPLDLSRL